MRLVSAMPTKAQIEHAALICRDMDPEEGHKALDDMLVTMLQSIVDSGVLPYSARERVVILLEAYSKAEKWYS